MVGLAFRNVWLAGIVCLFLLLVWAHVWIKRRMAKSRNPKDFGYSIYAEFGPEACIPRLDRLREIFPDRAQEELAEWCSEFASVSDLAGKIAEMGGNEILGKGAAETMLRSKFDWLAERGVDAALGQIRITCVYSDYSVHPVRNKDFTRRSIGENPPLDQRPSQTIGGPGRLLQLMGKARGLVGFLTVFTVLGAVMDFGGWVEDPIGRFQVWLIITLLAIPLWAYLLLFTFVGSRKTSVGGWFWNVACFLIHPIPMAIYLIALAMVLTAT
jgi:hypothetical protein